MLGFKRSSVVPAEHLPIKTCTGLFIFHFKFCIFSQYLVDLTQQWASNTTATSWTTLWNQSKSLWQTRTTGTRPISSAQEPTSASLHPTAGSPCPFSVSLGLLSQSTNRLNSVRMQRLSTRSFIVKQAGASLNIVRAVYGRIWQEETGLRRGYLFTQLSPW